MGVLGWVCYGFIHIIIAWLTVEVTLGDPYEEPAPQGAIGKVAQQPVGFVLLAVLAVGLITFALSQLTMAAIGFGWVPGRATRAAPKSGALGRAVLSLGLGALAARQSIGGQAGTSSAQQQRLTADLLVLPAGRIVVGLVAVAVLVIAVSTSVPGGQAELLRVPQAQFGPIKVPDGPPDEQYVYLSDVLPTAWQAVACGHCWMCQCETTQEVALRQRERLALLRVVGDAITAHCAWPVSNRN